MKPLQFSVRTLICLVTASALAFWIVRDVWPALHRQWLGVPGLIEGLGDPEWAVSWKSIDSLASLGALSVPSLVDALSDQRFQVRRNAAFSLYHMYDPHGADRAVAVPALARSIEDEEPDVREAAALAISMIGPKAHLAVPALVTALVDRSPKVRFAAVSALGSIGAPAKPAIPLLLEMLENESEPHNRRWLATAVWRIDKRSDVAIPVLVAMLDDKNSMHRASAARGLGEIGPNAQSSLSALANALKDNEIEVVIAVLQALGEDSEPQPDLSLRILPEMGGQSWVKYGKYLVGAPELIAEIAQSSRSIDLHTKKADYEKAGVVEYIVLSIEDQSLHWFRLNSGRDTHPDHRGIYRSDIFPGLWIDRQALLRRNTRRLISTVHKGIASDEHAEFTRMLKARARKSK